MTVRRSLLVAMPLLTAVLGLPPQSSSAATFDAYLKISDCDGPVVQAPFAKQIHITGFTSRIQNLGTGSTGEGGGAGKIQFQPIQILKDLDKCSPVFFLAAARGDLIKTATITFAKSDVRGRETAFFQITLTNVRIVSVEATGVVKTGQVDASAIQDPANEVTEGALGGVQEIVGLSFEIIELKNLSGGETATWDVSANKAL